jgi:hypothetical protein
MSFSTDIKNYVTKINRNDKEILSELSGIIRNIGTFDNNITITTENSSLARLVFKIIKDIYGVTSQIVIRKNYYFNKTTVYIVIINDKIDQILSELSLNQNENSIPNEEIINTEDRKISYLRGCFLSCGSINDPKTARYHLEFSVDKQLYAKFISNLLNEYEFNSKVLKRAKGYMVYIKEAEKIGDFLRMIKAYNAVMYYENIRIYRDHKNMINRLNNCEQANVEKTMFTALNQIKDINIIKENDGFDLLDEKTKDVCVYRLKYPETSLLELSEIITLETKNKISKSGLNHKFRKIKELSNKFKQ